MLLLLVVVVVLAVGACGTTRVSRRHPVSDASPVTHSPTHRSAPRTNATVAISARAVGPRIPAGFVGLSFEFPALAAYAGSDPRAPNPVLEKLIQGLAPGQRPVLRVGGDSTDTTWWPASGLRRPAGVTYSLSRRWLAVTGSLARAVRARLIIGLNLEAGRPRVALLEARALLAGIGADAVRAFEIGNEPPSYPTLPWYRTRSGGAVFARPRGYGFAAFAREFGTVARLLPRGVRTAGPTLGGATWIGQLGRFVAHAPRLGVVTFHQYPFDRCFTRPGSVQYPTVLRLLSRYGSRGIIPALTRYVSVADRRRLAVSVDETNSVACGGKRGVSNTFASALWALDSLFALARVGVAGADFHAFPGAAYAPFGFRRRNGSWSAAVRPVYYGMLMFAHAAPAGSRLLALTTRGGSSLRAWCTRTADGTLRVVLINDALRHGQVVAVRAPTETDGASLVRMTAPSAHATGAVRIGDQTFGRTSQGVLPAPRALQPLAAGVRRYVVSLAPASAALLTLSPVPSVHTW